VETGIGSHIARGAAWMVGMRWLMRAIGLINTVVLARLLTPDDFGVVAMSAVVVELLMMLGDTNVDIALIRDPETRREIYDSAWTVQVLFGLGAALLVVVAAQPLAAYYDEPRVAAVMYVLALRPAILGFENVGVAEFRKALDFAKEFRYNIWRRVSLFAIGLALALILQSYWALAIAAPVSAAVAVLVSFLMSSYRPRLRFSHALEVWGASRWFITQNLAQVALERGDELIIGGVARSATVGTYYIAAQTAPMPTREIAWPVERALMPTYAKVAHDPEALRRAVIDVMGWLAIICIAAGVGIMSIARDFVLTVFGANWEAAVPFFKWLAIFGIFAALGRPLMPLFYVLRREKQYAILTGVQVAVTAPALIFAAHEMSLVAVAAGRTIIAGVFFVLFCAAAARISTLRARDLAAVLWRPAVAGFVMWAAIEGLRVDTLPGHILPMIHDIAVGAATFTAVLLALWWSAGKPDGPERAALTRLRGLIAQRQRRFEIKDAAE